MPQRTVRARSRIECELASPPTDLRVGRAALLTNSFEGAIVYAATVVICAIAVVACSVAAVRTVRQREPLWPLISGVQFGLVGMIALGLTSRAAHSPALDLVSVIYGVAFVAFAVYALTVQKRYMTGR
jgi:FtsH-binding integral membrane protein